MAKDERIFRVTKQGYRKEIVQYKSRNAISGMFATTLYGTPAGRPDILKVEAIDPAEIPWTDVTDEFRKKRRPRCAYHTAYTGVRKPSTWKLPPGDLRRFWTRCTCTSLYLDKHPDYPRHSDLCDSQASDPADCPCQMTVKLLG